jgi:hypothetical protein
LVISGVVRTTGGDPVQQARVYFTAGPVALPDIAALTDEEGSFTLSAPDAGTYRIECLAEGFAPAEATVEVAPGQESRIELRLTD